MSVFLSLLDVHVARSPVAGTVIQRVHVPGIFLNAALDRASDENERLVLRIGRDGEADIAVVLIAGQVARRIRGVVEIGDTLRAGQRIGLIRFGSRVDVYLPPGCRGVGGGWSAHGRRRNRACRQPVERTGPHMRGALVLRRRRRRLRGWSFNRMVPNSLTVIALCAGLTSIRFSLEGRWELAVLAVVVAGIFDVLDGGAARLLRGTSKFGAELDSLSDFIGFGAAPAVLVYQWTLTDITGLGWAFSLLFAVCCACAWRGTTPRLSGRARTHNLCHATFSSVSRRREARVWRCYR